MLQNQTIDFFETHTGYRCHLHVTYRLYGQAIGAAPVVLVNHALTGNSKVCGDQGWWNALVGPDRAIDTNHFTVLAIDIPGNGHDGISHHLITNYKQFNIQDIARVQLEILERLKVNRLYAVVGGSLGGQIAWALAALAPNLIEHLVPIASDWKATDWVIALCRVQDQILNNSKEPIQDARMHAMTFYRSAASFKQKFQRKRTEDDETYAIESWLQYHGNRLEKRFRLEAYKLMNHLLGSANIVDENHQAPQAFKKLRSKVHLVAINSDGLFLANEIRETHHALETAGVYSTYSEIDSVHGHDAFLIAYDQLETIIKPIFENALCHQL